MAPNMSKFVNMRLRGSSEYSPVDPETLSSTSSSTMHEDKGLLSGDDQPIYNPRLSSRRRFFSWRNTSVVLSALLFISGISVWGHVVILLRSFRCDTTPLEDKFEPDLLFSSRVTFQPHAFYGGPPTNATDEMWQRLQPPGDGIISIPRKYTTHLPKSLPAAFEPESDVYGISMFHQLHCLNFLRFAYYPEGITTMPPQDIIFHRDHCLDYIRQAIMCHGDTTFEILTSVGVNGMGATHTCRDFDKIWAWAYENRSDKTHGSGYTTGKLTTTPGHLNDFDEATEHGGHGGH
ncbi:hypothetical protein Q9L58_010269 [Maublancomyces gigas]|uniref:Oxidase ustYa n=1 Tax=Discina gigas TaxID=1032678 RepID=A0ABR3G4K3_9PEZI